MEENKQPAGREDFLKEVRKRVDDSQNWFQEVAITKVSGECPYGHREGEIYKISDIKCGGLCGSLYRSIHDAVLVTHYDGIVPWEKNEGVFSGACPEMGKVKVSAKKVRKENLSPSIVKPSYRDMTGKGFSYLDKYKIFVEINDIAINCGWGHKKGQRIEIDPFNAWRVCSRLYANAYYSMIVILSDKKLHWQFEDDKVQMTCPDTYNITTFTLVREKR